MYGGGGKICAKREKNFAPPPKSFWGGANLNRKFKTLDFLDTLKVYTIQSNYHTRTTLSLHQTKLAEKKQQINVFNTLKFQILNCDSS